MLELAATMKVVWMIAGIGFLSKIIEMILESFGRGYAAAAVNLVTLLICSYLAVDFLVDMLRRMGSTLGVSIPF